MKRRGLAAFLALVAFGPALLAHDFWIEPSSFHPPPGSELSVSLRVGQHFRGDPVPRDDRLIARFVLSSAAGEIPIGGLPATDPAGFVRVSAPGLAVIGYRSNRTPIELDAGKFEEYLAEEGLDAVLQARAARDERRKPGREVYSRCAKSLVAVGGSGEKGFDRVLGLTLELVADASPLKTRPGGKMPFRIVYEGKPLAGALVKAIALDDPDNTLSVRSDARGRVAFLLARKGVWLVKAVHMVPAPAQTRADWESLWASLTFEIP